MVVEPRTLPLHVPTMTLAPVGMVVVAVMVPWNSLALTGASRPVKVWVVYGAVVDVHETSAENELVTVPETTTVMTTELAFEESVASTLVTAAPMLHVPPVEAGVVVGGDGDVVVPLVVAWAGAGAVVEPARSPDPTRVEPRTLPWHVPTMTFAPVGMVVVAVIVPWNSLALTGASRPVKVWVVYGAVVDVHETSAENELVTVPETTTVMTTELAFEESVASTLVTAAPMLHVPPVEAGVVVGGGGGGDAVVVVERAAAPEPTVVDPRTLPSHVPTMTLARFGIGDVAVIVP